MIEKRLKSYSFDRHRLQSLEEQLATLPLLRSSSDFYFSERIDTGGAVSSPVEALVEKREAIEARIKELRRKLIPMEHFLSFLRASEPIMLQAFELRYVKNTPWNIVAESIGLSTPASKRLRKQMIEYATGFFADAI